MLTLVALLAFPLPTVEKHFVGEITIHGNTGTTDGAILRTVNFYPGQPKPSKIDLREAEERLLYRFRKRLDLSGEDRLRLVLVEQQGHVIHELQIHFPEKLHPKKR